MAKSDSKGSEFEKVCQSFFSKGFEEIGFLVLSFRRQWSGTQNGFDIRINFLDDDEIEKILFFECKDYVQLLYKTQILGIFNCFI